MVSFIGSASYLVHNGKVSGAFAGSFTNEPSRHRGRKHEGRHPLAGLEALLHLNPWILREHSSNRWNRRPLRTYTLIAKLNSLRSSESSLLFRNQFPVPNFREFRQREYLRLLRFLNSRSANDA